jgi:hypothetical protein
MNATMQEKRWTGTWWQPWTWRREFVTVREVPITTTNVIATIADGSDGEPVPQEALDVFARKMAGAADNMASCILYGNPPESTFCYSKRDKGIAEQIDDKVMEHIRRRGQQPTELYVGIEQAASLERVVASMMRTRNNKEPMRAEPTTRETYDGMTLHRVADPSHLAVG